MPIFEYLCSKCGQIFEELVYSKETPIECPNCGDRSVEKQLSTFGVGAINNPPCYSGGSCGLPQASAGGCGDGCCPGCIH